MSRIDSLIADMTLTEKLGQMTMATADSAVTGAVMTLDLNGGIASGEIGNVLNLYGADKVHAMQRLAVEKTRLHIPLLIGFDVIHGHRTLFPIHAQGEAAAVRSRICGKPRRAKRRGKPPPTAFISPSRPCWMSRATLAGAGSRKVPGEDSLSGARRWRGRR